MKKLITLFIVLTISFNAFSQSNDGNQMMVNSAPPTTIEPNFDYFKKSPYALFFHTIKQNETLETIAKQYNLTVADLMFMNNLKFHDHIAIGQELLLENRNQMHVATLQNKIQKPAAIPPSVYSTKKLTKEGLINEVKEKELKNDYRILQIEDTRVAEPTLVHFIESTDIAALQKQALQEKKLLFINFYADWCAPCKVMQESTFRDSDIAIFMNQYYINVHVNADSEKGKALRAAYAVNVFPTLLFYDVKGDEIARKEGSLGIEDFKKMMAAAYEKGKSSKNLSAKY